MKLKLAAVMASVLLLATGAAVAMPGSAPDHAQDDDAQAADHSQGDEHAREDANESDAVDDADAADNSEPDDADKESDARRGPPADLPAAGAADAAEGSQGPPVDMPEQVPDFVNDVHETIGTHIDGTIDGAQSLGERISALTPGDEADADAGNATASDAGAATATPTP
ncbi:MAG: hypothetical protein ABEI39_02675 [Halobacteriales archaeon]